MMLCNNTWWVKNTVFLLILHCFSEIVQLKEYLNIYGATTLVLLQIKNLYNLRYAMPSYIITYREL